MSYSNRFIQAVEIIIEHEVGPYPNGGYTNNPNDRGGETKWGISKRTFPHIDIKNLSREGAVDLYHRHWWQAYRYEEIRCQDVAMKVFDIAVPMGGPNSHRVFQRALKFIGHDLKVDGIIGPVTRRAANESDPTQLLQAIRFHAAEYYYAIAKRDRSQRDFLMGWLNRAYW